MVYLRSVQDISPDHLARHLQCLGESLGVMNMLQAFLLVEEYMDRHDKEAVFLVNDGTYFETARKLYSLIIFNYACMVHEEFLIPSLEIDMSQRLKRSSTVEEHTKFFWSYMAELGRIIDLYGDPGLAS